MKKALSLLLVLILGLCMVTGIASAEEKKTIAGLVHCETSGRPCCLQVWKLPPTSTALIS